MNIKHWTIPKEYRGWKQKKKNYGINTMSSRITPISKNFFFPSDYWLVLTTTTALSKIRNFLRSFLFRMCAYFCARQDCIHLCPQGRIIPHKTQKMERIALKVENIHSYETATWKITKSKTKKKKQKCPREKERESENEPIHGSNNIINTPHRIIIKNPKIQCSIE